MKGDILIVDDNHRKAALGIAVLILKEIGQTEGIYTVAIAGESGAGKSEVAASLAEELAKRGLTSQVLQQDDYFILPPLTNAEKRKSDICWVGPQEVRLDILDANIGDAINGADPVVKPLVDFQNDTIAEEEVHLAGYKVIIAEGTYTSLLDNIKCRVFIDRSRKDTADARAKRGREKQDEFLERILEIEHNIISAHKPFADIIVTKNWDAHKNE